MVKRTQTISRQQPTDCLSVFDHCVRLKLKGLNSAILLLLLSHSSRSSAPSFFKADIHLFDDFPILVVKKTFSMNFFTTQLIVVKHFFNVKLCWQI